MEAQVNGQLSLFAGPPPIPQALADLEARHQGALAELLDILREQAPTGRCSSKRAVEEWRARRRPTGAPVGCDNTLARPIALWAIEQEPWLAQYIEVRGGRG